MFNTIFIQIEDLRVWGGFACFLLWIKMFQWMRLFKQTAHFITLIAQIFVDVGTFNFMMLVVMAAFGNFYYVLNNNTPNTSGNHYVGKYTHIRYLDALIQMYIFALGELDLDAEKSGPNHIVGFILFCLSTFVLFVIFMNLLIAIIQDTYNDVKLREEQSSL